MFDHKLTKVCLSVSLGTLFLLLFVFQLDLDAVLENLRDLRYQFLAPALLFYFVAFAIRVYRWQLILSPVASLSIAHLFSPLAVGYMANNLLPVRMGEVIRAYYLARKTSLSTISVLGTLIVERTFDGLILACLFMISAVSVSYTVEINFLGDVQRLSTWLVALVLAIPFVVSFIGIFGSSYSPRVRNKVQSFIKLILPGFIGQKLGQVFDALIVGLRSVLKLRIVLLLFLASALVWIMEAGVYYWLMKSFRLENSFDNLVIMLLACVAVTAISNLATALPTSQGGIGPFEFFATLTLLAFDVEVNLAGTYVMVLHLVLLLPITLIGLLVLWRDSISLFRLSELRRHGSLGESLK